MSESKQILVLTPIYPASDIPTEWTPVVHYFAREWVRMGHRVVVVNYQARFPNLYYRLARPIKKIISSKLGFTIMSKGVDERKYEIEGVPVYRICLKKLRPHGRTSEKEIKNALIKTIDYCKEIGFAPDAITAHWDNPQLEIMYLLKEFFRVKTCYIAHSSSHFRLYGKDARRYWEAVDIVGYRSAAIKRTFEISGEYLKPFFMCYSGIPACYNDKVVERSFEKVSQVAYVGTLIQRKYPTVIIPALVSVFGDDFCVSYAGEGQKANSLKAEAARLGVTDKVKLLGRIDRPDVFRLLDKSDLFIMISRNETFGLVYLEAMARGCITIASRNEGFDGIIEDGRNGFLCNAGDVKELTSILHKIKSMTKDERKQISDNAMATAKEVTDENVATTYLKALFDNT